MVDRNDKGWTIEGHSDLRKDGNTHFFSWTDGWMMWRSGSCVYKGQSYFKNGSGTDGIIRTTPW